MNATRQKIEKGWITEKKQDMCHVTETVEDR